MNRVRLLAVLLCGAAVALPAAPAHGALETILQDDARLLHRPPEQVAASMARLRALGVDRVRMTANWAVLTRDSDATTPPAGFDARDPAAYEQVRWGGLDEAVRRATAAGMKVMIDVGFWAPHWAAEGAPGPRARKDVDPKAFADFAVAVARRYGGGFTPPARIEAPPPTSDETFLETLFRDPEAGAPPAPELPVSLPLPRVDQFALWNEPNHPALLLPQWRSTGAGFRPASPALYARMVRAAYPAAKAVRPDARFLVGNTSSDMGTPGSGAVGPLRFIRDLACVDRALRSLRRRECRDFERLPGDGWAHHPYSRNRRPDLPSPRNRPDNVRLGDLDKLSALLRRLVARDRLGPGLRRIHLTEFGFETGRIRGREPLSQATQARWLTWAEHVADRVPGVVSFAQFLLGDQAPAPVRVSDSPARPFGQYYTGLQTADGRDKLAASTFTAGLFAQRRSRGRVLLWGRLRLGSGSKAIEVQRRAAGAKAWRTILRLRVGGRDSFSRTLVHLPGSVYRLRRRGADGEREAGLTIRPVAAPERSVSVTRRPTKPR